MEHTIEFNAECEACDATGLYVGMAERDGAAVVCHRCKGSGQVHRTITYNDFEGRKQRENVRRVFRTNPGICIGQDEIVRLEDFGGLPYDQWLAGTTFSLGSEDRRHTCPAWFYQSADYKLKPDWKECLRCGTFSGCKHFPEKARCWARFDREQSGA